MKTQTRLGRIDYMPGPAAVQALSVAGEVYPDHTQSALIDRLVIVGLSALMHEHNAWRAPYLPGRLRNRWKLPEMDG